MALSAGLSCPPSTGHLSCPVPFTTLASIFYKLVLKGYVERQKYRNRYLSKIRLSAYGYGQQLDQFVTAHC